MELNTIEKQLSKIDEAELGSDVRPARSCYDLKLEMPHAESGEHPIPIYIGKLVAHLPNYPQVCISLIQTLALHLTASRHTVTLPPASLIPVSRYVSIACGITCI